MIERLEPALVAEHERGDLALREPDARRLVVRGGHEQRARPPRAAERGQLSDDLTVGNGRGLWTHGAPYRLPRAEPLDGQLDARAEPLDGPREAADLVRPLGLGDTRAQVATADPVGDLRQPPDGAREGDGQRVGDEE